MVIKCKLGCEVVDCNDCAEEREEGEKIVQEIRDDIKGNEDKETMFDNLQSMIFLHEHCGELINLCKTRLRELGVTIPEEEGKNG